MFFFFAGSLTQQVRQVLKYGAGKCISCGSPADLVEYDKVLKLFFVPVWRWPGKEPLMHCNDCNLFFPDSFSLPPRKADPLPPSRVPQSPLCGFCHQIMKPEYKFCPYCGSPL